ncbi:RidA family protein [Arthrobacter ginkgonis]|uniref:RidA family protein n=1 Tax=Arthrobacter ginkgonis TaxID=1630594 RepID=A0ABP7DF26_9MICC
MTPDILQNLTANGWVLPAAAAPKYAYEAVAVEGNLAYVSGQIPKLGGNVVHTGPVSDHDIERGIEAAELCALNLLAQLEATIGLENVRTVLKLNGYVSSADGFTRQPEVIDGASKLIRTVLGDAGGHARTALPAANLPADATVEIELVVATVAQGS